MLKFEKYSEIDSLLALNKTFETLYKSSYIDVAYVYSSRFFYITFKLNTNSLLNKVPKISTFLFCKNCKKLKKINENGKSAS